MIKIQKRAFLLTLPMCILAAGCGKEVSKDEIIASVRDHLEQPNETETTMESNAGYYIYLIDSNGTSVAEIDTTYYQMILNPSYVSPIQTMSPDTADADLNTFVVNASQNIDESILETSSSSACLALSDTEVITLYYSATSPFTGSNTLSGEEQPYTSKDGTQTLLSYRYCTGFENGTNVEVADSLNNSNVYFYYDTLTHIYGELVVTAPIDDDVNQIFNTLRESVQTLGTSSESSTEETANAPIKSFGLGGATQQYSSLDEIQQNQTASSYQKQDTFTMLDGSVYNLYLCTGECQINGLTYTPQERQWICLDSTLEPDPTYGTITTASIVSEEDVTKELNGCYIVGYDIPYNTYTITKGSIQVYSNPPILSMGDGALELSMQDPVYEVTEGQIISLVEGTYIRCTNAELSATME